MKQLTVLAIGAMSVFASSFTPNDPIGEAFMSGFMPTCEAEISDMKNANAICACTARRLLTTIENSELVDPETSAIVRAKIDDATAACLENPKRY